FRNYLDYKQAEVSMEDYLTFPVSEKQPRPRFHNVFWPGENVIYRATLTYDKKFMVPEKVLASLVTPSGNPCKNPVTGELYEQVQLTPEGPPKDLGNSKQSISFRGEIWDPSMIEKGGKLVPEEIRLRVKLFYHNKENGELKQQIAEGERVIIMDNERPYYDPHFD
ncbi:MAG: hypothetical protein RR661_05770, partial [Anaerovoracaceae bacterium]